MKRTLYVSKRNKNCSKNPLCKWTFFQLKKKIRNPSNVTRSKPSSIQKNNVVSLLNAKTMIKQLVIFAMSPCTNFLSDFSHVWKKRRDYCWLSLTYIAETRVKLKWMVLLCFFCTSGREIVSMKCSIKHMSPDKGPALIGQTWNELHTSINFSTWDVLRSRPDNKRMCLNGHSLFTQCRLHSGMFPKVLLCCENLGR